MQTHNLESIFSHFNTNTTFQSAKPYGSGHINDTYLVITNESSKPDYILQRINHHVFKQPRELLENIDKVTHFIKNKLAQTPQIDHERHSMTLIKTHDKKPFYIDEQQYYWACYICIRDSYSHDLATNTKQANEAGRMIGQFLNSLADFPSNTLYETLPNFHNVEFRLANFEKALQQNHLERITHCQTEVDFAYANADMMQSVMRLGREGKIPLRVVHNDTKFNNILFDENDNGLCLIDLDTVMPGYVHYDFSDAVRTITNTAAEDEKDLSKIQFNTELFSAFSHGFIHELKTSLNSHEIASLAIATPLMPFIHGLRFLTDYLSGDTYYKIHFPEHNLQRARAQFQLVRCIQAKLPELNKIILQIAATIAQPEQVAYDH